jgi:hypothetical protein
VTPEKKVKLYPTWTYFELNTERYIDSILLDNKISNYNIRGDQEGLFKLVTLDRILNPITVVTSGC